MTNKESVKLLPCPFCGRNPEILRIGNNDTRTRSVTIQCMNCRVERTISALRKDMEWLERVSVEAWNTRYTKG